MASFDDRSTLIITCPNRIASLLAGEVASLDLPVVDELPAAVVTEGSLADAMRLNLHVRTGHRVLFLLASFDAYYPDEMYAGAHDIAWEEYLDADGYVSVISSIDTESIDNTQF